jgi:AcrR family transcriptional regulator
VRFARALFAPITMPATASSSPERGWHSPRWRNAGARIFGPEARPRQQQSPQRIFWHIMLLLKNNIQMETLKKLRPDLAFVARDAKRDHLLQAARDEFLDKGLEGATMRGIGLRAGCTTGAIYPLFDSKEAVYAALLEQSLSRLDAQVAEAVAAHQEAAAQLEAGCHAFVDYYLAHPFEVNLGLYAFRGLKPQGVGKDTNKALNQALWTVLARLATPLAEVKSLTSDDARSWAALLFSQMIGALVLQLAGRLDFLQTDASALLHLMVSQLTGTGGDVKKKTEKAGKAGGAKKAGKAGKHAKT